MKSYRILLFLLFPVFLISCYGQEAPPEKALKYHGVLLKRPQNETLFDRFYSAWIDEQPVEALEKFLMSEAEEKGGQAWSVLARYQLRRGQEDAALVSLGKAMEEVDDPSLPMERAKILMRRLAFDEARKDLGSVAAGDAELALEAGKMIGKSWIREGNSEEAIKAWDALLQENPDDEDLLEDLVESAATEGETEQALKYVEKLIAASGDPYQKTLRALRRGDLLALAGRMDDAVVAYSETLALVGEGSWLEREVLAQIEKLFRSQDRLDDLLAELTKLSEANPRRLLIHRQLAKLEAAQGDTDGAIGRFREVLKRSPGNAELREEFVKLLMESELYDDAVAELEKMIELAKDDAGLQLRMAGLRNQQGKKDEALKALEKAHELAGGDEISGVQVAGLMFQYGLPEQGEALLKSLIELAEATTAPSESLAAQYGKTQRKEEAIVLWKKIAAEGTLDTLLRASAAVSGLGESGVAFELLSTQAEEYPTDTRFLTVLAQISLAADKAADGVPVAMKLVRLSKGTGEIASSVPLAMRVIIAADKSLDLRADLEKQEERSVPEICLLAALAEGQGDFDAVETLFAEISDPILIRFHAAILDRRGEFERAIAALIRLADTDEGRKASFFKELSELQERAGKTDEALATMEKWKQAAPGDKTAWVVASALLRDLGKPDDAARMTRQAVAKFDGDEELSATLASLHEEAGDWADAEGIYWRLYDAAVNPMDQLRWGSQLAQLALKTGRTEELDAKLQERSRGNRKSIGPILARAELARLLKNEDSRRDLLLEAVRLQPKDVDLRLQIANLEEQDGNAERVIAVLQEAVGFDQTGRVRSALAQAYLRQGRTVEGMRELRAIAGARGDDPRSLESSAASLAGAGLYDEAIRFLSESLKDGGDWRSRYLLAVLLEADGRETEAIPIFLTLQQATGELKGTKPKASKNPVNFEGYAEGVRDLIALNHTIRMAYVHEGDSNYSSTSIPMTGVFYLPQTEDEVKELSAIHLAKLSSTRPEVAARAKAVGMDDLDFLAELTKAGDLRRLDWGSMLEKFPKYPGLLETVLLYRGYGQGVEVEIETLSKLVEEREDLSSITRFQATRLLAEGASGEDPIWDELIDLAKKSVEEAKEGEIQALAYSLMRFTQDKNKPVPDAAKEKINAVLLDLSLNHMVKGDGQFDGYFTMFITATAGTTEQWIGALNTLVKDHQDELAKGGIAPPQRRMGYRTQNWNNGQDPFVLAKLGAEILESLPADYIFQISGSSERSYYQDAAVDPKDLVAKLEQFESPLLRAWVAHCAEEEKVLKKALAVEASPLEAADFNVMRAFLSLDKKKYAEAYRLLELNRAAYSAKREKTSWLNFNLVALALEMTKEERAEISDDLRALLIQCRRVMGVSGAPVLAEKAKVLGFEDLAKRFLPPVIVSKSSVSRMGGAGFSAKQKGQSSGGGSLDKLKKFSSEGKTEAAAREALLLLRKALGEKHNSGYELRRLLPEIQKNVRQEVVRMIDPNDSPSLTKRKEYARICALFGKNDLALKTLELLATDRPDDVNVASELAFLLPPEEKERAVGLINRWAKSDDFVTAVIGAADRMSNSTADKESLSYFGLICGWLEKADPADLKGANLSWVAYQAKGFMESRYSSNLPSLIKSISESNRKKANYEEYVSLSKRLALAMIRQPGLSEPGFRLLNASNGWEIPPAEMDEFARQSLLVMEVDKNIRNHGNRSFFTLVRGNGSSSSGNDFGEQSTVRWLSGRLAEAKSTDEILPAAYLKKLSEANPEVGELIGAMAKISKAEEIEPLWNSEIMKKRNDPVVTMLREGVLVRVSRIPGALDFFRGELGKIKTEDFSKKIRMDRAPDEAGFVVAALNSSASMGSKEMDKTCEMISRMIFGEKIDWDDLGDGQNFSSQLNWISRLLSEMQLAPAARAEMYRSFYALDTPVANSEYYFRQPFDDVASDSIEAAIEILDDIGMFQDIVSWRPIMGVYADSDYQGAKYVFTKKTIFLDGEIAKMVTNRYSNNEVVKLLKARDPQSFGSLITTAAMSSGKERMELTKEAFNRAKSKLAGLPPESVEALSHVISWLPAEEVASLPAVFRDGVNKAAQERVVRLKKQADDFLTRKGVGNAHRNSPFNEISELVGELLLLDFDKAVEVFLEAEKRYTESLLRGGRYSSYTSNNLQISERDEALNRLISNDDRPLAMNPVLALRFYNALVSSEAGQNFSYTISSPNRGFLYRVGELIAERITVEKGTPLWVAAMEKIAEMPEEIRTDALVAFSIYCISSNENNTNVVVPRDRNLLAKMKDLDPDFARMRSVVIGVKAWGKDGEKIGAVFSEILGDEQIDIATRMQLAVACLWRDSDVILDPVLAPVFQKVYTEYVAEGRSAVTPFSTGFFERMSHAEIDEKIVPFFKGINDAFWGNANSSRAAGHSQIPPEAARYLLIIASQVGDETNAKRTLLIGKQESLGDLVTISCLIGSGAYDSAMQLLAPKTHLYQPTNRTHSYTARFEERLAEFGKQPGVDPLAMLRLEAFLLEASIPTDEKKTSKESKSEREARLVATYKANPPKEKILRTEILGVLTRDSHIAALALSDEMLALTKELDFKTALLDWRNATDKGNSPAARGDLAPREAVVIRQAAFLSFLEGDLAPLMAIHDAMKDEPLRSGNRVRVWGYLREIYDRVLQSAPLWTAEAVHLGKTDGFVDAVSVFEAFTVLGMEREEINQWSVSAPLSMCQFFAYWTGDPSVYDGLLKKYEGNAKIHAYHLRKIGLYYPIRIGAYHKLWKREDFAKARQDLLLASFTRPEMKGYYGADIDTFKWFIGTGDMRESFLAMTDPFNEDIRPDAVVQAWFVRGEALAKEDPGGAVNAWRKAVESMAEDPVWGVIRERLKCRMVGALLKQNKTAEAKEEFAKIDQKLLKSKGDKKLYNRISKAVGKVP